MPNGAKSAKISFHYLVRSETDYDFFNFYINGTRRIHESGAGRWESYSCSLSPGTYTILFEYAKDSSNSKRQDAAFVDNINIQYEGSIANYNVSLDSTSYDLDHQSESGKGIVEKEWKWKEDTDETWTSGKLSTLALNKNYLVWLRVKDIEGAWSDPYVQTLSTMSENLPPIAQFTVDPSTQIQNKAIAIIDQSFDPNGDPIAEWKWRVKKPNGTWLIMTGQNRRIQLLLE